ncbi:acetylhydrolase [Actinoplanes sp. NPDC026623]|uniref:alpha/beta hydrolase n=1 Tax=Actinoplanes sp. NPDC026623 TaxID=3155610 RepID=UPI0033C7E9F6
MRTFVRRLGLLLSAVPLLAANPAPVSAAVSPPTAPIRLTLPAPTVPQPVGTVSLHLVDHSRPDPWGPPGAHRELMISLWYPTRHRDRHPVAPWLPMGAGAAVLAEAGLTAAEVTLPVTHGHEGAPVAHRGGLPVVLYSPGNDATRADNTIVVEQLVSHGYLVVTMDHTYDGVVEFPDGRVVTPLPDGPSTVEMPELRLGDVRFVLRTVTALNAGRNPDVEHRGLPRGLTGAFDLSRIGMFGVSAGGATTASTMYADARVRAGLSLDGPVHGPVVDAGLDRPFLLMQAKINRVDYPDLARFWSHLRGWHLNLGVHGAAHVSYADYEAIVPQLAPLGLDVPAEIGDLDPARGVAIQQTYPLAFFEQHLRHRGHLLDEPSAAFPEVYVLP